MVSRKLWREGIREGRVGSAECEGKTASEGRKGTQGEAELLKGRILGSRIPDIFQEYSRHFWLRPKTFVKLP